MKRSLMRPTAALFPIVLLAAALMGSSYNAAGLFISYISIQLFSLCSVGAFRNAAAREVGIKRVDRRFSGTWITILLGIAVTGMIGWFLYGKEAFLKEEIGVIIAAGCIVIEQMFEERMFAISCDTDGVVQSVISNALLFIGLMLDAAKGVAAPVDIASFYTICAAGLGMLISVFVSYLVEPMHAFSLLPRNIGFFPKAAMQTLLFPLTSYLWMERGNGEEVLAGMIIWNLSRTVCRRSHDESRPLNLLLTAVCGGMIIANIWFPGIQKYVVAAIVAMLCAVIVFCAPSWRLYIGTALLIGAFYLHMMPVLPENWNMIAVITCSAIAVILNIHKAFLKKV